jgi:ubiquinone/menaquinone biosynthesis C-methylase UbiE
MRETEKKIEDIKRYRRRWYNAHAGVYDKSWWESEESKEEMDGFKNLVRVKSGELVLDVATGTGIFLIEMAKDGAACYGVDISTKMLEQLRHKIKRQKLESKVKGTLAGVADRLPYRDNLFDWITCIGMLEYYPIEYAETVLKEMKRVLKLNKKCFIDIVDPAHKKAQNRRHVYKYNLKTFEDLINKTGFKILTKNTAGRMIQYLLQAQAC